MTPHIKYFEGYKYVLAETYEIRTAIIPRTDIITQFLELRRDGTLLIRSGYAWDGPSGPAIDTRNLLRGSLVHDAFYQLMREGFLDPGQWRDHADRLLRGLFIEDSLTQLGHKPNVLIGGAIWEARKAASYARAWWIYGAVKTFARRAATPEGASEALTAP